MDFTLTTSLTFPHIWSFPLSQPEKAVDPEEKQEA